MGFLYDDSLAATYDSSLNRIAALGLNRRFTPNRAAGAVNVLGVQLELSTPALLFPAISLLLLAYTNRFLALATLVRNLHAAWEADPKAVLLGQIANLRSRLRLIRNMQFVGVLGLALCTFAMLLVYVGVAVAAKVVFLLSLLCLLSSLGLSLWEIWISTRALELQLSSLAERSQPR